MASSGAVGKMQPWHVLLCVLACSTAAAGKAVRGAATVPAAVSALKDAQKKGKTPTAAAYSKAITACFDAENWAECTRVFREMQGDGVSTNLKAYNTALEAYGNDGDWESALALLEEMRNGEDIDPDAKSYGFAVEALREASEWDKALGLLEEMPGAGLVKNKKKHEKEVADLRKLMDSDGSAAVSVEALAGKVKVYKPSPIPRPHRVPIRPLGPSLEKVKIKPGSQYAKEIRLLQHVFRTAVRGKPNTVCDAIEKFGEGVLRGQWLKVAGAGKVPVLQACVQAAPPGGFVLEIGAYCGFSSSKLAQAVPDAHITTLEVDPVHVIISRNIHQFGGLQQQIDVWTGHSKDILSRLSGRYGGPGNLLYSVAFFDQKGSRYDEDLTTLERLGMLYPGSVCVADNVLKPGAPILLWHVGQSGPGGYHAQVVSMREFAMPAEDWMSVSVRRPHFEHAASVERAKTRAEDIAAGRKVHDGKTWEPPPRYIRPDAPPDLMQLNREADRIRDKATNGPGGRSVSYEEWDEFAQMANARMAAEGIVVTAESVTVETGRTVPAKFPSTNPRGAPR